MAVETTAWPEAATSSETLLSFCDYTSRGQNNTYLIVARLFKKKSYQRHLSAAEMMTSGPTTTPLPLQSRTVLQVCSADTSPRLLCNLAVLRTRLPSPQIHMLSHSFTAVTALGNVGDISTRGGGGNREVGYFRNASALPYFGTCIADRHVHAHHMRGSEKISFSVAWFKRQLRTWLLGGCRSLIAFV